MINYNIVASTNESTVVSEYQREPYRAAEYQSEADLERNFITRLVSQGYERLSVNSEAALIANLRRQLVQGRRLVDEARFDACVNHGVDVCQRNVRFDAALRQITARRIRAQALRTQDVNTPPHQCHCPRFGAHSHSAANAPTVWH